MAEFPLYSANRATVSAGCRPTSPTPCTGAVTSSSGTCAPPPVRRSPYVVPVKRCRHAFSATSRQLTCGCLNVRSLSSVKVDAVLSEFNDRDRPLDNDILCLTETWHDPEFASINRLVFGVELLNDINPDLKEQ